MFVKELRNAYVGHDKGFALAPQIEDVKYITYDALRPAIEIETPERIEDEPVIVIGGNPNLGHFIFEFLTRLAVLDRHGYIKPGGLPLVFWPEIPAKYLDLVRECVPNEVRHGSPALFRYAFIPSCPVGRLNTESIYLWPDCTHWLRHRLRRRFGKRRVYAYRDSLKRKCLNAEEVKDAVLSSGFELLDLAQFPLIEQAQIVSESEFFITDPGAGASLSMFVDGNSAILEFGNRILKGVFGCRVFVENHGNAYIRLDGEPTGPIRTIDADYTLNVLQVKRAIEVLERRLPA